MRSKKRLKPALAKLLLLFIQCFGKSVGITEEYKILQIGNKTFIDIRHGVHRAKNGASIGKPLRFFARDQKWWIMARINVCHRL